MNLKSFKKFNLFWTKYRTLKFTNCWAFDTLGSLKIEISLSNDLLYTRDPSKAVIYCTSIIPILFFYSLYITFTQPKRFCEIKTEMICEFPGKFLARLRYREIHLRGPMPSNVYILRGTDLGNSYHFKCIQMDSIALRE